MTARSFGGGLLVIGGILMLVASVLTWATVSGPGDTVTVNGFNQDGYITDGFAIVLLLLGILVLRRPHTWVSVVTTVIAVLAVGWALIVLSAINSFSTYYPDISAEGVTVTVGVGVIVVVLGAALCLVGAIASFFGRRTAVALPPPPPAPA
jgi:hypothetical protein